MLPSIIDENAKNALFHCMKHHPTVPHLQTCQNGHLTTLCRLQANWRHDIQHDDTGHEHELGLSTVCQIPIICFHYYIKM